MHKMKNIALLICITLSGVVHATESVDCSDEVYWLQLHYNLSDKSFGGFSLHRDGILLNLSNLKIETIETDFEEKTLKFEAKASGWEVSSIQLVAEDNKGVLVYNSASKVVSCDWSAFE